MNDDFVTHGIESDRYLKATRLIERFEKEIRGELTRIGDQIVEEAGDWFPASVTADWNNNRSSSKLIAFARVDYKMSRIQSHEDPKNLKLNLSFRWVDPIEYGHDDADGALTLVSYKMKNITQEDYHTVKDNTADDSPIQFADDVYGSPGIFYIPISNASDAKSNLNKLKAHFLRHGDSFGVNPSEND